MGSDTLTEIVVRVTPRASSNRVETGEDGVTKVYVTVPPESGKANECVIELLAEMLNVPKSCCAIKRGHKSRIKTIVVCSPTGTKGRTKK
ncbi:MAG: DUF167 domain-containing protein [Holosporales bacterium]|jgi:uncharacterized protein YggU (UPF0235/DUF167 family)|nr:DUF167 domain-containing protein [Holosporales bacterium]